MYNLRTLIVKYGMVHFRNGGLDYLPDKLRYLHWEGYPLEELPSSFNPENLVELDLTMSKIKQLWEGGTLVPNLKRLNLENSLNLISIPNLSNIPSVEIIDLEFCSSLIEIHSSRECPKLKQMNLRYCNNLISIPDLSNIPSAEIINLEYCSSLIEIHSSRECPKLKKLNLANCSNLISIPDLSDIPSVESINLKDCISLREIHSSRERPNLKRLNLSFCENLIRISNIPSAKSINLEYCSSLLEIHSSRECPKNLHSLHPLNCSNLRSFPSNIHIEGSEFSLYGCISLTKFPHISGNIKRLRLSGSGVEEVPSTIQSLSKLESINMQDCRGLKCISKSICKLKSLSWLDLSGCCKLESFPDILEGMELKYLNLRGTAIKELSPSIGNLNRLEELILSDCKNLEKLPSSLQYLEARNCKQLIQSLPEVKGSICLPGSEIPECFSYKNIGSSINIPVLRNDCGRSSYIMGFAVCLAFRFKGYNVFPPGSLAVRYNFYIETSIGRSEGLHNESISVFGLGKVIFGLDHIVLGYKLSRKCYEFFQELDTLLANRGLSDHYVGTSFVFSLRSNDSFTNSICHGPGCELKYCGIQPIYVRAQVMNFVSINQDTGDTSGCNDTVEEICEPHPTKICTEEKDFEGFIDDNSNFNSNNNNCKETAIEELDLELRLGHSSFYDARKKDCEVKYCGIQLIYVQAQDMNSVAINQDTGDTSGYNDTAAETCEPHPTSVCTEAKDSERSIDDNNNFNGSNNNNRKETAIEELDLELRLGHSSLYDACRKDCEAKHCGIHPIYVQSHVMDSVAINQDTGDKSRSNDSEETCETHPTRIWLKIKSILLDIVGLCSSTTMAAGDWCGYAVHLLWISVSLVVSHSKFHIVNGNVRTLTFLCADQLKVERASMLCLYYQVSASFQLLYADSVEECLECGV
ncbi:hypothetical protein EZV62_026303 [Acer yangbiense]|uniref:Uncharacterized protein n=1 Tax=Acer yangbiense TaxID=1000413 RepID=A0A5C7GR93_9ROSI|nr:hypothetical protein EZV62_026303 [Acer yangbiense]